MKVMKWGMVAAGILGVSFTTAVAAVAGASSDTPQTRWDDSPSDGGSLLIRVVTTVMNVPEAIESLFADSHPALGSNFQ